MTHQEPVLASHVGLIAGGGVLPFAVADSLKARGVTPILFALKGFCDPVAASRFRHHWVPLGRIGRLKSLMRDEHCRDLVFIGTLVRPALSEIRMDWGTLRAMRHILSAFRGGDDHLLTGIGRIFEDDGFRLLGIKDVAPDLLMPAGSLCRARPDAGAEADITKGLAVLGALSPFDIGQATVVIDGHVIGVEGIEGTDGLLARVAQLRAQGRIRARPGRGVLVKAPKSGQDLRFDMPTLGPQTIARAAEAGLAGIAIVAGNTIVAEPQQMVDAADAAGLFVTGVTA
ncbi:LpxI family protein [Tardiphaga sp. vice352]|uniref:LpxI family protein n=1 Tax=unclassified Tardiphaga TaxID=2631404 RepID=UPI0011634F8F|nr:MULTISPECIES: UDP-2,3-diacylglucosamine diphosphatase LpxI [unclassified Tardiphaga]QDM16931.1 LpxI family protein [Tardiphaga sp. vice278]QDM27167.1 LpxI family protein [Tardiphaga sp. vice304]QDM32292.1 LpxI family protein [Tardiphaga sp. vice352]